MMFASCFNSPMRAWKPVLCWLLLAAAAWPTPRCHAQQDGSDTYQRGVLIRCEGPITPLLEQYLFRKLDLARQRQADLVISRD